jgi:hypothetical protein
LAKRILLKYLLVMAVSVGVVADSLIAEYRLNAANCFDLARVLSEPGRKAAMLAMAAAWLKLAEIAEKGESLLRQTQHLGCS